ncbi:MAG: RNase adapter RapZ [Firmicutes bacterium]|nr:RNase adapter RapZ [Bacillota bacterium]
MKVLIVTGLSGAGKSNAIKYLEDMGYYCIDNMPPALLGSFMSLESQDKIDLEKAAFVMDIRGRAFFNDLEKALEELRAENKDFKVLFLEATDDALVRRFKETRRVHPLSDGGTSSDAIQKEKKMLANIRENADFIINTTDLKPMELQNRLQEMLADDENDGFVMTIQSFGYKHGMSLDADIVFDVRFIPNPYYIKNMKELTGNDKKVRDYVNQFEETQEFITRVSSLIEYLIPYYMKQGKRNLVAAFGCTGGQHRSVSMANEFSDIFNAKGRKVTTVHRDILKR